MSLNADFAGAEPGRIAAIVQREGVVALQEELGGQRQGRDMESVFAPPCQAGV
ncbi:hypothetical protein [Deinococcus hopiensis]|uniref:hypothetical protein n=1 Tax=Deinococcus hopiensis TaxID=309885 RepID=UPI001482DD6B|nr:hypothetical protein [Deinococcus hopiensis]